LLRSYRSRVGRTLQRVQFGGHICGFGRAYLLEDRQHLPQRFFGLCGAAVGQGAPAKTG